MKKTLNWILAFVVFTSMSFFYCKPRNTETSSEKFTSKDATLARIEFEATLRVSLPDEFSKVGTKILSGELRPQIDSQLNEQLDFLTGSLLNHKFFDGFPAAVYGKPKISILGVSPVSDNSKAANIRYKYTDNGAFNKKIVSTKPVTIPVVLPTQVQDFYEKAKSNGKVVCVANNHTDQEKFWYYWKVDALGCQLKAPLVSEITATVTPLPQTQRTYPWYNETFGNKEDTAKKVVKITLIFDGSFEENQRQVLEKLKMSGFIESQGSIEEFKVYRLEKEEFDVVIDHWVLTGGSGKFKEEAARGLTQSDIFVYVGHSSYGRYLDPTILGLKKESFDQNKPQYFYFAGCRTFKYYNAKFFDLKPQKLNIVATSVPSYGMTFPYTVPTFISYLTDARRFSWQDIISAMHDAETEALSVNKPNGYEQAYITWPKFKALLSVNGDENNPTNPR